MPTLAPADSLGPMQGQKLSVFVCVALSACGSTQRSELDPVAGTPPGADDDHDGDDDENAKTPGSGSGSGTGEHTDSVAGDGEDDGDSTLALDVGSNTDPGGGANCGCENVDDGIYVLGEAGQLWFYDPPTNAFSVRGSHGCDAGLSAPFSMSVSRRGEAWMDFIGFIPGPSGVSGTLHRAPVSAPGDCANSGYMPAPGFGMVGMAFASEGEQDNCDQLYMVTGDDGSGTGALARLGPGTLSAEVVGALDIGLAELSGTGDGRLFAFAAPSSGGTASLHQLDKESAAVIETVPLTGLSLTQAFAFGFWGGDFYFFTESSAGNVSAVTRLDYDGSDGGGLVPLAGLAPIRIVGAGVSTCASLTPEG